MCTKPRTPPATRSCRRSISDDGPKRDHQLQVAEGHHGPLVANLRVGDRLAGELVLVGEGARQHLFMHRPTDALQASFEVDLILLDDLMRHLRLAPLTDTLI